MYKIKGKEIRKKLMQLLLTSLFCAYDLYFAKNLPVFDFCTGN